MNTTRILARFHIWRMHNIKENTFILLLAIVVGVLAGFVALIMKVSVFYLRQFVMEDIIGISKKNMLFLLILPGIGIGLTLFFKHIVIKDKVKHNISSILFAISKKNSLMKKHKVFSSLLGGILTAGFGGSVGVESPIISSGAAIGSNLGRIFHLNYKTITLLLACGSAGAIAAIFNTPIAGVIFALEVLLLDLSRFSLIPLLIASISGTIVTTIFYPDDILFDFKITETFKVIHIHFYIIFAFITGIVAYYFKYSYLKVEDKIGKIASPVKRFLVAGVSFGFLLFLFPALWGEGFSTIKELLNENHIAVFNNTLYTGKAGNVLIIIALLLFLILLKTVATSLSVSAGGIGGIFAPSLYTGAITGYLYAFIINNLNIGVELSLVNFTMIGMAGVLSGVLHAPLTALFLIAEITFGYELIVPLMIISSVSFITVKYFSEHSIVTAQLALKGELITHHKDKAVLTMMKLTSVIEKDFSPVSLNDNLGALVKKVAKSKRNIYPVLGENNTLCGIILLDDIREIMFNKDLYEKKYVKNLMSIPPAFIKMDDSMEIVMEKFNKTGAWNLPVISKGQYVGFVSKSKMFNVYRQHLVNISSE